MPRIDAHQHFWRYSPTTHGWIEDHMAVLKRDFLPPDLEPLLEARGYQGCVAVQAQQTVEETTWLLELADRFPFIRAVVGWVDLRDPDVATVLRRLVAHPKLRGIRHIVQSEPDDQFLLGAEFQRGIAALAPHGLAYDILIDPRQLPAALELVKRFPTQPFVLDHLAKPDIKGQVLEPWAGQVRKLAASRNVFCKVSGLVTEADWPRWKPEDMIRYLDVVLEAFGPDRLMIGSDWPVCLLAGDYGRVMSLVETYLTRLPPSAVEAVRGGTATRFYRLASAASPPGKRALRAPSPEPPPQKGQTSRPKSDESLRQAEPASERRK
jgi:L-fuconolactonase